MADYQDSKAVVLRFYRDFEAASPARAAEILDRHTATDYRFRGVHPFNELEGAGAVAETVWRPLLEGFTAPQRRQDILMAGTNEKDGEPWVISMGNFMGLFDRPWLGIPPTGKIAFLPYAEFHRIEGDRIAESALFFDLIRVMVQAGLSPLPMQTGAEIIHPGPRTHDGQLFEPQDEAETTKTMALVNRMKDHIVSTYQSVYPRELLAETWHEDMLWYGPSGIGSTYTIDRYRQQHQLPFRQNLADLTFNGHVCRLAEGRYAGWFGWPNLTMTPTGGFMGLPATERRVDMRVVDIYRRAGDKLAENWVLIDIPHWLLQQGVDVLERARGIGLGSAANRV